MDSYNNDDDSTTTNNANMPQCVVIKCKKKIKIFLIGYMPPLLYFTLLAGMVCNLIIMMKMVIKITKSITTLRLANRINNPFP